MTEAIQNLGHFVQSQGLQRLPAAPPAMPCDCKPDGYKMQLLYGLIRWTKFRFRVIVYAINYQEQKSQFLSGAACLRTLSPLTMITPVIQRRG